MFGCKDWLQRIFQERQLSTCVVGLVLQVKIDAQQSSTAGSLEYCFLRAMHFYRGRQMLLTHCCLPEHGTMNSRSVKAADVLSKVHEGPYDLVRYRLTVT